MKSEVRLLLMALALFTLVPLKLFSQFELNTNASIGPNLNYSINYLMGTKPAFGLSGELGLSSNYLFKDNKGLGLDIDYNYQFSVLHVYDEFLIAETDEIMLLNQKYKNNIHYLNSALYYIFNKDKTEWQVGLNFKFLLSSDWNGVYDELSSRVFGLHLAYKYQFSTKLSGRIKLNLENPGFVKGNLVNSGLLGNIDTQIGIQYQLF